MPTVVLISHKKFCLAGPIDDGEESVQMVLMDSTADGSSCPVKNSEASDDTPSSQQKTASI